MSAPHATAPARRLRDYSWLQARLGTKRGTLASMVSRGQLPFVRIGPRLVRFDEDAIEQWIAERSGGAQ